MPSKKSVKVYLPNNPSFAVELPPGPADTIERIIAASTGGISSLKLVAEGVISVHNHVAELRKRGFIIETERKSAQDWQGKTRKGIAHYSYQGWTTTIASL